MYDELVKWLRSHYCGVHAKAFKDAADAIEELTAINQRQLLEIAVLMTKPRWIPVTERLPKENGFYLCLYKHKASGGVAMDEGLSILQWINNKWGINDIYLVTHWMPIPQPPEDGES